MYKRQIYNMARVAYGLSGICNLISLIVLVQMELDTIGKILCTMITIMYLITDMIVIMYAGKVVETLKNQKKFKSSL